jgi:hypothetical protein
MRGAGLSPKNSRVADHRRTPNSYVRRVRAATIVRINTNLGQTPRFHVTTNDATRRTYGWWITYTGRIDSSA